MVGQTLQHYCLPLPLRDESDLDEEVTNEMSSEVYEEEVTEKEVRLLQRQKDAFDMIYGAVEGFKGGLFFIDVPGGTGKTFLLNLLLSKVRLNLGIAFATASSGIAPTLFVHGRTAHITFKLPFNIETPMCKITNSPHVGNFYNKPG